jgi:hypothetical protein
VILRSAKLAKNIHKLPTAESKEKYDRKSIYNLTSGYPNILDQHSYIPQNSHIIKAVMSCYLLRDGRFSA